MGTMQSLCRLKPLVDIRVNRDTVWCDIREKDQQDAPLSH